MAYIVAREMYEGDTLRLALTFTKNNAPLNLTGATIYMTAKNSIADADPGVFQLTSPASGISITNAVGGLAEAVVSPSLTTGFTANPTVLVYDIKVKEASGDVTTLESGTLKVNLSVTRTTP